MTKRPLLSANLKVSAKRQMRDAKRQAPAMPAMPAALVLAEEAQPAPAPTVVESMAEPSAIVAGEASGAETMADAAASPLGVADSVAAPAFGAPVEAVEASPGVVTPEPSTAEFPAEPVAGGEVPAARGLPVPIRLTALAPTPVLRWSLGAPALGENGPAAILAQALVEMSAVPAVTFYRYATVQVRLATSLLNVALRPF